MKRSGFTLVEMLTVVAILGLLGMIAVPAYQLISKRVYQNMYENKVKLILTAAESFAQETTYDVVNVGHLIQSGKLEADNEAGDYQNPVTKESMLCDVVRIDLNNFQYQARLTEEKNCSFDDLIVQNSLITIKKYKENGTELRDNEWYLGNVTLKVLFLESGLEEKAVAIKIQGNGQNYESVLNKNFASKNSLVVSASQILNARYEAYVTVNDSGVTKEYKTFTMVQIDKQRPTVYMDEINIGNENSWVNQDKKITFTMSDGSGSGIYGYTVSTNRRCGAVGPTKTSKQTVSVSKPNGTYYICVRDNAGNWSEDISTKSVTVSKIDTTPPQIDESNGFTVTSIVSSYNHYKTKLHIVATDESVMSMYLSNVGFEQGGTWERYTANKEWNVANTFDGANHYVYLTLRDEAGNKVNVRSKAYRVYSECSITKKEFTSSFGECSVSCGGGYRYRTYEIRDIHTAKVCSSGSDQEVCNTHSCENPDDYDWSKKITCNSSKFQDVIDNGKFKNFIEYQGFRDAMFDCASTVESIIRKSPKAIADLRGSSRYSLATTRGKYSKECKVTCPSNCNKDCKNPKPCYDADWYPNAIHQVYGGKALIISASAWGRPCFGDSNDCRDYCDEDGYCNWEAKNYEITHSGDILVGQLNGEKYDYITWYTVGNDYIKGDAGLSITFLNGFGATAIGWYSSYSLKDNSCKSDDRTIWRTANIAIQYFRI